LTLKFEVLASDLTEYGQGISVLERCAFLLRYEERL